MEIDGSAHVDETPVSCVERIDTHTHTYIYIYIRTHYMYVCVCESIYSALSSLFSCKETRF